MKTSRIALVIGALVLGVALLALAYDGLYGGYVDPTSGDTSQVFEYHVYWSGVGEPPTAYVHIDDDWEGIMMDYDQAIGGSHGYKYSTTLPSGDHGFYFTDSMGGRDPNGEFQYVGPDVD
ncbi:MAG TPA: hypothetical protein VM163_07310 [bacterium]|nr:hypothetical protein [bacterium]